jgi:hypothetical protein
VRLRGIAVCARNAAIAATQLMREPISAFSPLAARKQASFMLIERKKAGSARVLNAQGEIIYKIDK